ncbi:hypothetical protein WJX73_000789 [Symbiochloris irregularis]|uniref:protein-serine/threonine phosphatase n=1 Tax=Symbiochloris irregularis TaxID=706552 RepID=A0AAW1NSJ0_9CHLO
MGHTLSTPITTKESVEGENELLNFGACAMQGWRSAMEDAHCAVLDLGSGEQTGFFGVFDGHGGPEVARYCSLHMAQQLISMPSYRQGSLDKALRDVYLHIDELLPSDKLNEELKALSDVKTPPEVECEEEPNEGPSSKKDTSTQPGYERRMWSVADHTGCTAVVALLRGRQLWVANAGDSRCVVCHDGKAVAMTKDHMPGHPLEHERIVKAGGSVYGGRIKGRMSLSRALGDFSYKQADHLPAAEQMIIALPEIQTLELGPGHEFLLLASDGIWEVLGNGEAVAFVREGLAAGQTPKQVCEALCDRCMSTSDLSQPGPDYGYDNMTAIVVQLKEQHQRADAGLQRKRITARCHDGVNLLASG